MNEAEFLPKLLGDIRKINLELDYKIECVVVDGGSQDGTVDICRDFKVSLIKSSTGRGRQLAAGAQAASGEIFLFVHADCRLSSEHCQAAVLAIEKNGLIAGGFHLQFDNPNLVLQAAAAINKLRFGITKIVYGDHGLFVARENYYKVGGYKNIDLFEDVEFSHRLKRAGRVKLVSPPIRTSTRRFKTGGIVNTYLKMAGLHICYWLGVTPERLAKWYLAREP